ncbi:MAG: ATP phosphoribosyltransferase regulatory subunit [Firmicutes bacterium]|nr:ATP phosphoribosyltransferase regulatory subunit [Bacillota bacterium]
MKINEDIFSNKEKAMFALRQLYASHGFSMYRMSKFEEFELYAANRDFLDSSQIITFTDTDGMLMALKPDVTLSIVKNNRHIGNRIIKLYYNENIYRVSPKTHYFKEIMQVGLECLGKVDDKCISEVLLLAAESLKVLSEEAKLDVSNLDILTQLFASCGFPKETEEQITACISGKNAHSLERICRSADLGPAKAELLKLLVNTYGKPEEVIPKLEDAFLSNSIFSFEEKEAYAESIGALKKIVEAFKEAGLEDILNIDFSVVSDLKYYNGIIFKGFSAGVPDGILSGGQYDKLMKSMKRTSRAIGFGVYMDNLGKLSKFDDEEVEIDG